MLTIRAMRDIDIQSLPELDVLYPTPSEFHLSKTKKILIQKRVEDSRFGPFDKDVFLPLYTRSDLRYLAEIQLNFGASPSNCIGLLFLRPRQDHILGYVSYYDSVYHLALPVHNKALFSPLFFRVVGYLPTNYHYLAVVHHRVLFWVILAGAVWVTFTLSYLSFTYGFYEAIKQLSSFWQGLWPW